MRRHDATKYELVITRHAKQRFCQRAQTPGQQAAARHLTPANAVQTETLVHCARNPYAITIDNDLVARFAL